MKGLLNKIKCIKPPKFLVILFNYTFAFVLFYFFLIQYLWGILPVYSQLLNPNSETRKIVVALIACCMFFAIGSLVAARIKHKPVKHAFLYGVFQLFMLSYTSLGRDLEGFSLYSWKHDYLYAYVFILIGAMLNPVLKKRSVQKALGITVLALWVMVIMVNIGDIIFKYAVYPSKNRITMGGLNSAVIGSLIFVVPAGVRIYGIASKLKKMRIEKTVPGTLSPTLEATT